VNSVKVATSGGAALINRTLAWTGETLISIVDAVNPLNNETLTYSHAHRLKTAIGPYGSLSWSYDSVGNRLTQTVNAVAQTYVYPTNSNMLSSIAQAGAASRLFIYDAAGNRASDATAGSSALGEQYDGHGNLKTFLSAGATQGAYTYDAFARLAKRVVTSGAAAGTRQYLYDQAGHVVAETDQNGVTLREYVWLDDMPIGVIDQVNSGAWLMYYVHADHLDRPVMMTNLAQANVWSAVWSPFGAAFSITGEGITITFRCKMTLVGCSII
jgi:YD repeat-containing protein